MKVVAGVVFPVVTMAEVLVAVTAEALAVSAAAILVVVAPAEAGDFWFIAHRLHTIILCVFLSTHGNYTDA